MTLLSSSMAARPARQTILKSGFDSFARGFSTHRMLYAIALLTFAMALMVAPISGNWPDVAIFLDFSFYLLVATAGGILTFVTIRFTQLVLFERPESPTRELLISLREGIFRGDRLSNTAHSFLALIIFVSGFSILKGAIGLLHPFDWDPLFRDLDIALSGGRLPHEWLDAIFANPFVVWLINVNYNLWYLIVLGTYFGVGMAAVNSPDRMRYLTAFFLLWLGAGIGVAFVFSSAGPVYYERLGLGTDYAPLMASLHAAAQHHDIWALATQDTLWDGFTGARKGSAGIAAFPSLHVASSVLVGLYFSHCGSRLALPAWIFAAGIMLGSVVLAWHYAVDGYAGAILAWIAWKASGWKWFQAPVNAPEG